MDFFPALINMTIVEAGFVKKRCVAFIFSLLLQILRIVYLIKTTLRSFSRMIIMAVLP